MQTVNTLKYKTRYDLVHTAYVFTICVFLIEVFTLIFHYFMRKIDYHISTYVIRYMILPTTWNILMCISLSKINESKRIDDNRKLMMMIFCITKICASIAVIHAYFIPTQCVFIAAIIAASLIGNSKLIIFACCDSLLMLSLSIYLSQLFSDSWSLESRIESAVISAVILIMTSILSNAVVKTRYRSNLILEHYILDLEKATKEAKLDMMTGLYNHAEFYSILRKQINKHVDKITVAILDIDHFKHVNDSYGHDNGDKVILRLAEYARRMNDDDTVFASRYGGEEFAFIFVNLPRNKIIGNLQTICKCIRMDRFDFDENKVITISAGVFECESSKYEPEDIFSNADTALYYSKEHGRNQVNVYNDLSKESIDQLSVRH